MDLLYFAAVVANDLCSHKEMFPLGFELQHAIFFNPQKVNGGLTQEWASLANPEYMGGIISESLRQFKEKKGRLQE